MAARLAGAPAVIGFDVMNEPPWGSHAVWTFEAERLVPLYDRVVAEVRAEAPGWGAFLEPAASRNLGFATALPRPAVADVVYAPHAYDADAEAGRGFDPAPRDAVLANGVALAGEAAALGAAL